MLRYKFVILVPDFLDLTILVTLFYVCQFWTPNFLKLVIWSLYFFNYTFFWQKKFNYSFDSQYYGMCTIGTQLSQNLKFLGSKVHKSYDFEESKMQLKNMRTKLYPENWDTKLAKNKLENTKSSNWKSWKLKTQLNFIINILK